MKTLILLSGLPGVGKSTWARKYAREHPFTMIVSSDELRKVMTGEFQNFTKEKEMWQRFYDLIIFGRDHYQNITVIVDATNLHNQFRIKYGEIAGFDHKIYVDFKKPIADILKQNAMRVNERIVPIDVIKRMELTKDELNETVLNLFDECWNIS